MQKKILKQVKIFKLQEVVTEINETTEQRMI